MLQGWPGIISAYCQNRCDSGNRRLLCCSLNRCQPDARIRALISADLKQYWSLPQPRFVSDEQNVTQFRCAWKPLSRVITRNNLESIENQTLYLRKSVSRTCDTNSHAIIDGIPVAKQKNSVSVDEDITQGLVPAGTRAKTAFPIWIRIWIRNSLSESVSRWVSKQMSIHNTYSMLFLATSITYRTTMLE